MKQHLCLLFTLFSSLVLAQAPEDHSYSPDISESADTLAVTMTGLAHVDMVRYSKLDSLRAEFNSTADSLQLQYRRAISELKAETNKINQTSDSLERLKLPTRKYKRKLDKLAKLKDKTEAQFSEKLNALKSKTTDKLNALELPPEYKQPLQQLTQQINDASLDNDLIKLPALDIPGYDLPGVDVIGNAPSLQPLAKGTDIANMPNVQDPGEVSQVTHRIQTYHGEVDKIANIDSEALQKTVESQASTVEGIDELQKQSGVIEARQGKLKELADPEKGKKKAAELAKKAAVDHFAGKEEQLKAAMEKMSKYKQKYSSVSSIKALPKRPPNAMKGKPFIERLTLGLYSQYQQKNFYLFDVNPYIGYRISGRFTVGLGWNQRFAYDNTHRDFNSRSRIFGSRTYLDFKLGKGLIAHLEGESMNTFVPSTIVGNPDTGQREWVWSFMTGLKKEYNIYKNLKGTALVQYNWFNRYYKAPYVDRLNSRIGFEYVLKKERK